jgi:hypothetical protein
MLDDQMISVNPSKSSASSQSNIDENRTSIRVLNREQLNLETHQLVWLDPEFLKNGITSERLRQIIDYTKIFDNIDDCLGYIEKTKNRNQTFLICTKVLSEELLTRLHSIDYNIYKTYVYTSDEKPEKLCKNLQVVLKNAFLLIV